MTSQAPDPSEETPPTGPTAHPAAEPPEATQVPAASDGPPAAEEGWTAEGASTEGGWTPEQDSPAGESDAAQDELTLTRMELAERTADLQRLQAEFLNYKRRVDRDRELIRENATYVALAPIIDVLDTVDRAREHGPLDDGLKAVADQLERAVSGLGLVRFGEPGDEFDPTVHDALSHIGEDPQVSVPTAKIVVKAGYKMGDRVVRAAQVLVVDPGSSAGSSAEPGTEPAVEPVETTGD